MAKEIIDLPKSLERIGISSDILKGLTKVALLDANSASRIFAIRSLIDGFRNNGCSLEKGFIGDYQMFLICKNERGEQVTAYIDNVPRKYIGKLIKTNFIIRNGEIYF